MAGGGPSCKSSKKCSWRYPHWELAKQQHQGKGFRFIWFYLPMARRVALHEMPLLLRSGSTLCRVRNDCAMLSWLKALPFGPDGSQQWTGFPDMAPRLQSQNIADIADYMTDQLKLVQTKVPYGHPMAILWPNGTRHAGRILDLERHLCIYSGTGAVQTRTFGQFGDRFWLRPGGGQRIAHSQAHGHYQSKRPWKVKRGLAERKGGKSRSSLP